MSSEKQSLIQAITASVMELQQGIDRHCSLVASIMDGRADPGALKSLMEQCPSRNRELAMKNAIKEAIDTLEESRKAFKSRQLEGLRKRLTQVLIDTQ